MGMHKGVWHWLMLAERAADDDARYAHLARAKELAASCADWRGIVRAVGRFAGDAAARDQELARLATRTLAAAAAEADPAGFTCAAQVRAALADPIGARAALAAAMHLFRAQPCDGPGFRVLAMTFAELFSDMPAVRECVALGCAQARSTQDAAGLCALAYTLDESGDREGARALVQEAEALLRGDGRALWSVADTWESLDDQASATRVRHRVLAMALDTEAALHVIDFLSEAATQQFLEPALQRASAVAKQAVDWLDIAHVAHRKGAACALVRATLDRAAALAQDDVVRCHAAFGYAAWLGDEQAADALGPRGFRPAMLRESSAPAEAPGSAAALFDFLRESMTPELLAEIAAGDYGDDTAEHLAALSHIQRTGTLSFPSRSSTHTLPWHPREVVSLGRWGRTQDLTQAFCCTLLWLCLGDEDPVNVGGGVVEGCLALGEQACVYAEQLFLWHLGTRERDLSGSPEPDRPLSQSEIDADAVARLALLLLAARSPATDPRITELARCVTDQPDYPPRICLVDGVQPEQWRELIARVLVPHRSRDPQIARLLDTLEIP